MEKKSKLLSFRPLVINNLHQTYEGTTKDGPTLFYKFVVSFENGDEGEVLSTKQEPSWKLNVEYGYLITERVYKGNKFYNIKHMKDTISTFNAGGGKSLEDWKSHAMQIAIECTADLFRFNFKFNLDDNARTHTINKLYEWICNTVNGNDKLWWRAFSIAKSAVVFSTSKFTSIDNFGAVILLANELFAMCKIQPIPQNGYQPNQATPQHTPQASQPYQTAPIQEYPGQQQPGATQGTQTAPLGLDDVDDLPF